MIEFFKLIGRNSIGIGIQKERERSELQDRIVAGRLPSRPACTTCTGAARSTARSTVARRTVDQHGRPTGMPNSLLGSVFWPVGRRDSRPTVRSADVRLRLLFRFRLRF